MKGQNKRMSNKPTRPENMFQKVSAFVFQKYRVTSLVLLAMVVAGMGAYGVFLQREGFPSIQTPIALTSGEYLAGDAEQVDKEAAKPVSDALLEIDGVEEVTTTANANFFTVATFFDESTSGEVAVEKVQSALAETELPENVKLQTDKIEIDKYLNKYNILLSLSAREDASLDSLDATASALADKLQDEPEIVEAAVESPFTTGDNPETGEEFTIQSGFSRYGRVNDGVVNVKEAVTIGLLAGQDADIIEFSEAVEGYVNELNNSARYSDYTLSVTADFATSIETQISSLQSNLITGLLAVAVVTFLLITWRASIITALFVVTVVMVTLLFLYVFGYTLNTISLFGLVLALGLFVDDATIIVEAIDAGKVRGKKPLQIMKEAVGKVGAASFAGTMTTVLVFLPLVFVGGILGSFIRILPITIIIALVVSFILSLTVIPLLSRFILLRRSQKSWSPLGSTLHILADKLAGLPLLFRKSRARGLAVTWLMIGLSVVAFIGAGYFAGKVNFNIFPPSKDSDQLLVNASFPEGTDIGDAEDIADQINKRLLDTISQETLVSLAYLNGSEQGLTAYIDLTPFTDREVSAPEIIDRLENNFDEFELAQVQLSQIDAGPPVDEFPFKVQILSEDRELVAEATNTLTELLLNAEVERPNGTSATVTAVNSPNFTSINRTNGDVFYEFGAGFDADDTSALVLAAQEKVETSLESGTLSELPIEKEQVTFDFGQESDNAESFSSLTLVFPLALLGMYVLLVAQFRSLLQPLLIFMAIPFSMFGVMAGLYLTNNSISFFAMVGFFGLIGIAVNNTILLTDYANQEKRAGARTIEAISQATKKRFRPLLTTSITTVAALLPLAMSDPFWEPLAYTIIFGLISSTTLVVLAFPYYYLAAEWLRMRVSRGTRVTRRKARS